VMRGPAGNAQDALVLTLDPAMGGGVRTMQRVVCQAMERMGLRPHLAFARSDRRERWDPRLRQGTVDGRPCLSTGYVPSIEFLNYVVPALSLRAHLRRFAVVQVVSGVHSLGLVPILGRRRFVSWVATPFLDEIESRAAADRPSASVRLNHALRHLNHAIERRTFRHPDVLFALSEYTAGRFAERASVPPERLPILRCPVDTARYRPDGTPWAGAPGRYIVSVGRVDDERKDYPALVRAFARIADKHPDVHLVLVGELWPGGPVKPLVHELGLSQRVIFTGSLEGDALAAAYRGADLFVLTSRQEGLGIVILEAQASGTPPLIMRCGGGDELIRDGEDGWLIEAGDEEGFAERLHAVLGDDALRRRVADAALTRVRRESSLDAFTSRLADAYRATWPELRLAGATA
jgi:glycosyltransferase involved in cell wall biosynthesis